MFKVENYNGILSFFNLFVTFTKKSEITSPPHLHTIFRYGDRTPVTILGRLFGIVWTLVGLVLLSIMIGTLSNSLITITMDTKVMLYGAKVRLVKHQDKLVYIR
jgi:hypothetical protein